jgi:hypothetical protein
MAQSAKKVKHLQNSDTKGSRKEKQDNEVMSEASKVGYAKVGVARVVLKAHTNEANAK